MSWKPKKKCDDRIKIQKNIQIIITSITNMLIKQII